MFNDNPKTPKVKELTYNSLSASRDLTTISVSSMRDITNVQVSGFEHRTAEPHAERKNPDDFALLEYIARFASTLDERLSARKLLAFRLQDQASKLMPGERVEKCLKWRVPVKSRVEIWRSEKYQKAHYKNLIICGSVWMCPVCASKITERRRVEVDQVIQDKRFLKVMVTFTLRHNKKQSLNDLYDGLSKSYRDIKSGRKWKNFQEKSGIVASIRGAEITYGFENGWHPHFHVLFFVEKKQEEMTQEYKDWFTWEISKLYAGKVAKNGFEMLSGVGVKVGFDQDHVSSYAAKWGMDQELAKSPAKMAKGDHYTPFQILLESAKDQGKEFDHLFIEYANAMKGKKQLVWSKGSRDLFELVSEATDQEIAEAEEEKSIFFMAMADQIWKRIIVLKARGELLRIAGAGDREKFIHYLVILGIHFEDHDLYLQDKSLPLVNQFVNKLNLQN